MSGTETRVDSTRSRWALLVGVNGYVEPTYPSLKFCVNDIEALERVLKRLGYSVVALHDRAVEQRLKPTRDNIEAELKTICATAQSDDLVLVHFSCHGKLAPDGPRLITQEIRAATFEQRALPLADVEAKLRGSPARQRVLLLDACHTGVELGRDIGDATFIQNVHDRAEGFALIAGSTAQQKAQEWEKAEHGVFTYFLLRALSGEAKREGQLFVTVQGVAQFVLDSLRRWSVENGGLIQDPTARTEGLGDMILADYRGGRAGSTPGRPPARNPFGDRGRIVQADRFFDREDHLRRIFEELEKGSNLSIVGESQVGKSSLLSMIIALGPERLGLRSEDIQYISLQTIDNEEEFYVALADAFKLPEPLRGFRLTRALAGRRLVVCLDEIEKMAWKGFTVGVRSHLRGLADGPGTPLKLVIASRSPLTSLFPDSPELDSPLAGICRTIELTPFEREEASTFVRQRLAGSGVAFTDTELAEMVKASQGHPARLQELAAKLFERYQGHGS